MFTNMNCSTIRIGIPIIKRGFRILCRNTSMPKSEPIEPPKAAKQSSVVSLILHLLNIARYLSMPNITNDTIEIIKIYINSISLVFFHVVWFSLLTAKLRKQFHNSKFFLKYFLKSQ